MSFLVCFFKEAIAYERTQSPRLKRATACRRRCSANCPARGWERAQAARYAGAAIANRPTLLCGIDFTKATHMRPFRRTRRACSQGSTPIISDFARSRQFALSSG